MLPCPAKPPSLPSVVWCVSCGLIGGWFEFAFVGAAHCYSSEVGLAVYCGAIGVLNVC